MQAGQTIRQFTSRMGQAFRDGMARLTSVEGIVWAVWLKRLAAVLILFALAYYPLGMLWVHQINDDVNLTPRDAAFEEGQSHTVAVMTALIKREVKDTYWVANDPFFYPGAFLDNMPNFQMGVISAVARFSVELADQIGRTRGASPIDDDLNTAKGELQFRGTRWLWDFSESVLPTQTAEGHYNVALKALLSYNQRLAKGEAVFERRADNLLATLDRIALDIGSASADLDDAVANRPWLIDFTADDVFYSVKGQLYGYVMILRGVEKDFAPVIAEKKLESAYGQMLRSFEQAVELDPWVVINGNPDSQFLPSHLTAQGFYLLRARTQLREITDILLK